MSTFETTRTSYGRIGLLARFTSAFLAPVDHIAARIRVARTLKTLNALTDRELEDIGICRSEIEKIALGHRSY